MLVLTNAVKGQANFFDDTHHINVVAGVPDMNVPPHQPAETTVSSGLTADDRPAAGPSESRHEESARGSFPAAIVQRQGRGRVTAPAREGRPSWDV